MKELIAVRVLLIFGWSIGWIGFSGPLRAIISILLLLVIIFLLIRIKLRYYDV